MTQIPGFDPMRRMLMSRRRLLAQGAALGLGVPVAYSLMQPGEAAAAGTVSVGINATPTTMDLSKPDWVYLVGHQLFV